MILFHYILFNIELTFNHDPRVFKSRRYTTTMAEYEQVNEHTMLWKREIGKFGDIISRDVNAIITKTQTPPRTQYITQEIREKMYLYY